MPSQHAAAANRVHPSARNRASKRQHRNGTDDNEIRTGNAVIFGPYGHVLVETWKAGDDMVVADLDASLLEVSTGRRRIKTRRPELYESSEPYIPVGSQV